MASRRLRRLFGSRHGERRTGRRGSRPAERLRNERLEPRLALAADLAVTLVDGVVRIEGTSGDDAIFIRQEGEAVAIDYASGLNTTGRVTFPPGVERIEAQGGAGRDLFVLQLGSLADQVIVDTGPQADLLLSEMPVEVRNASGRDLFVPLVDQALPPGTELTSHRIDRPKDSPVNGTSSTVFRPMSGS